MPDAPREDDQSLRVAERVRRLLPRHARERLFDPSVADLVAERLRRGTSPPAGFRVTLLALDCLRVSFPRVFVRNRRPTPFAWGLFAALVLLVAIATLRSALAPEYVKAFEAYK